LAIGDKEQKSTRILLVDDDLDFRKSVEIVLRKNGYDIVTADGLQMALDILKSQKMDLMITDLKMNDGTGMELLSKSKSIQNDMAVIILTAYGSIRNAVEAMRQGAYDYIAKPFRNEELLILVEKALENQEMRQELNILREEIAWKYSFDSLVGISNSMNQLKNLAARVANSDIAILITGESGTGKELMAKAIHYHSERRHKKFVPIECSSIPENLLESEFFGHIKGSFTSAYSTRKGLFEMADEGTVFLDEVGDMPLNLQAKILRVLQESEIRPVGSASSKKIDVRIIAATNSNLAALVAEGKFREDLFYRLNVLPIIIPPLRERPEDISVLIDHFIKSESSQNNGEDVFISANAMEKLIAHKWPGNVRELENTIKRAIALSRKGTIRANDILFITSDKTQALHSDLYNLNDTKSGTLEESLKQRIETTLYANNWNLTKTATKLGIGRTTLWRKIKKYDIRKSEEILKE